MTAPVVVAWEVVWAGALGISVQDLRKGFKPLPFRGVSCPSNRNHREQARNAPVPAPPEALPPWPAWSALGARTKQDAAALLYGANHSALRRPGEAATGEAAAIPRARPPALLLTRIRARVLAYLSSPSGPLTVRNTESDFFYFTKNYASGVGGCTDPREAMIITRTTRDTPQEHSRTPRGSPPKIAAGLLDG